MKASNDKIINELLTAKRLIWVAIFLLFLILAFSCAVYNYSKVHQCSPECPIHPARLQDYNQPKGR
jgi:hypothetical protein